MDLDMTYFDFVEERHRIWRRRQAGAEQPWTEDPIMFTRKFTNVFRILDHGSQFLARMLYTGERFAPEDIFFQAFLYRYTNRPESWLEARDKLGRWPRVRDADKLRTIWKERRDQGRGVFSGAYVILPAPNRAGDKIDQAIDLAVEARKKIWIHFFNRAKTPERRFELLRSLYGVGDFMAMQILTDWNYGPFGDDEENDFIVPGPGCLKGIRAYGWTGDPVDAIYATRDAWEDAENPPVLPNDRTLSLMDVQNTFCEFFKYDRFRSVERLRKHTYPYRPSNPGPQREPFLPVHWN